MKTPKRPAKSPPKVRARRFFMGDLLCLEPKRLHPSQLPVFVLPADAKSREQMKRQSHEGAKASALKRYSRHPVRLTELGAFEAGYYAGASAALDSLDLAP